MSCNKKSKGDCGLYKVTVNGVRLGDDDDKYEKPTTIPT
jgi:hypothetical protein